MRLLPLSSVLAALVSLVAVGCTTYQDDLARGQRAYTASEYERALAIFRALEPDTSHLSTTERAQYAYLRGMTDYRMGYKSSARHWLAIAAAMEKLVPGSLPPDTNGPTVPKLMATLKELNEGVYQTQSTIALSDTPGAGATSAGPEPAADDDTQSKASGGKPADAPAKQPDE